MRFTSIRSAVLALLLVLAAPAGVFGAASLADFNAAVETAAAHNRVALGYLRTGNTDLATLELERLRGAWAKVVGTFGKDRPDAFAAELYTTTLTDISTKLVTADMMLTSGRAEAAETALAGVRDALSNLRHKSGITVLADCVLDANGAMAALGALDRQPLAWSPTLTADMEAKAKAYRATVQRCDGMAAPDIKASPEFRRLVDGIAASLDLIAKAVTTRDGDLFHRIVIELRSYDNLLTFRFG